MIKAIFRVIFHPIVLGIVGLMALSLLVWLVGPLVAIADYRPLEPTGARWILIGIFCVLFVLRLAYKFWKARATNRKLLDGLVSSAPKKKDGAPLSAVDQEAATLAKRFEDAVAQLRKVRVSAAGRRPGVRDLMSLSGRQYLYQLPWYVFIGAPGSGKTTALINSGLQFPLAEQFGTAAVRGVGGTRTCDWWFTDEAVMLDTAGRYTTQESDKSVDQAAWKSFLQLLKKFRPRRPINGILLTISVGDLLSQSAEQRRAQATAVRARIQELHETFGIRFPIYVLVTKADLMAGFMEFFAALGKEERAQVWGVTFPYRGNDDRTPPLSSFSDEFDALEKRLIDQVPARMLEERAVDKRGLIFGFSQQMSLLKPLLTEFLDQVFTTSKFEDSALLRGVYFASGTQEGTPIDRMMGQLSRAFGLGSRALPSQGSSGRSYFLGRLLREVVFSEQMLVGTNLKWERRRTILQVAAYAATALVFIGLVTLWSLSFGRNHGYLDTVDERIPKVNGEVAGLAKANDRDVVALLPSLAMVQNIAVTPEIADGSVPASMGFGLYQGRKLGAASNLAYQNMLRDTFLPTLMRRMEDQLRSASSQDPEYLYEALKAYLALHDSTHFDAESLKAWIDLDWSQNLPRDVTTDQRAALDAHLDALLAQGAIESPLPIDQALIDNSRTLLARYSLAQRIYSRLKRQGVGSTYPTFSIARAGGPSAPLVFERISGQPLDQGVPGFFSYDAYHKAFVSETKRVTDDLVKEQGWVMGTPPAPAGTDVAAQTGDAVLRLYLTDYANSWEAFVADLRLRKSVSLSDSIQSARILSAPDSPLPPLLRAIVREVTLTKKQDDEKTLKDQADDKVQKAKGDLLKLFGSDKPATTASQGVAIESIVDDRFNGLRALVTPAAPGQPAPVDSTLALINQVYIMLNATDTAIKGGNAPPPSEVPTAVKAESARMPEPVRSMMQDLSQAGAKQALNGVRANLSASISTNIGQFCRDATAGRYPFVRSSTRDVTRDDFSRLFAPGGMFDTYFQQNLANLVDTSTRPWSFRQINDVSMGGAGTLSEFQRAATIRDTFFRAGGNQAGLRLEFKPIDMDAAITDFILNVDGQLVKYSHGPQVPTAVQWPAPAGTGQVRVQISPASASGTSGFVTEGPWAMFRMFDKVTITPTSAPERFNVTFDIDGRKAQFEVLTSSVQNPFRMKELEQFQCPGGL